MARRKTLKKNEYQSFPNCYNSQDNFKGKWREEIFLSEGPLKLELGCGKAEFSYALAQKYPENNYLGIDLKMDRMWRPAGDALAASIDNLKFLCINLLDIGQYFEENEADEIWITFPDPFSKNRQAKHRMVNPSFMKQYKHILKPSASLHYKTDNLELFHYTLEVWAAEKDIRFKTICFDLHNQDQLPEDVKIKTTYEKEFLGMGKTINYACIRFED